VRAPAHIQAKPKTRWRSPRSATYFSALLTVSTLALTGCASKPLFSHGNDTANVTTTSPVIEGSKPLMQHGDDAVTRGDITAAAGYYKSAHVADPKSIEPMLRLGAAELALGQYSQAYETYRALQDIAPDNAEAAFRLGELFLMRGSPQAAIDQFNIALKTRKDDPALYSAIGVADSMIGKYELAIDNYRSGLKLTPDNLGIRNNLGLVQFLAGDTKDAIEIFTELAAMPNAKPRYRHTLALIYMDQARVAAGTDAELATVISDLNNFRAQHHQPEALGFGDGRATVLLSPEAAVGNLTAMVANDQKRQAANEGGTIDASAHAPQTSTNLASVKTRTQDKRFVVEPAEQLAALPVTQVDSELLNPPPGITSTPMPIQPAKDSVQPLATAPTSSLAVGSSSRVKATSPAHVSTTIQSLSGPRPDPALHVVSTSSVKTSAPAESVVPAKVATTESEPAPDSNAHAASQPASVSSVETATIPAPSDKPRIVQVSNSKIFIQVGAFAKELTARELQQKLTELGPTHITTVQVHGVILYRVRLGPMTSIDDADIMLGRIAAELNRAKVKNAIELHTNARDAIYIPSSSQGPGFVLRALSSRFSA
jgi:Flp pilus assembly protein TadD